MMRVGVLMFDEHDHRIDGCQRENGIPAAWASVSGDSAFRVMDPRSDLPEDVLWWSNLRDDDLHRISTTTTTANIRHHGWLRSSFERLRNELGLTGQTMHPSGVAPFMARLAQRLVDVSAQRFANLRLSRPRLSEDLASIITAHEPDVTNTYQATINQVADQPYVFVSQKAALTDGAAPILITRNRLRHARDLLSLPLPPNAGWRFHDFRGSGSDLEQIKTPFLVQCSLGSANPLVSDILLNQRGYQVNKRWMTNNEWHALREYADMQCHALIESTGEPRNFATLLPQESLCELSISTALMAEQVWTGLASASFAKRFEHQYSAAAAWLRAADRIAMFQFARRLHERGVSILSYGLGSVSAACLASQKGKVLDAAIQVGLLPPMQMVDN